MHQKIILLVLVGLRISSSAALTDKEANELFYPDDYPEPEFVTACFGEYGCFYTGPPFYDEKYRPVTVPPANNTVTIYDFFTPSNKHKAYDLHPTNESFKNSKFNPSYPTKVIIHGFGVKNLSNFMNMKDAFLQTGKYNVIVVNWTHDNSPPVWQAIANARLTAAKVAYLLNAMMKYYPTLKAQNIHLIGHSLGGQLCGFVGERIKDLKRISALDPGGPYFHHAPNEVRLDTTDADLVDVIHTNGGLNLTEGIGIFEEIGHIDFYPNGGNKQPGCEGFDVISDAPTKRVANTCSHNRAVDLYTSSIHDAGDKGCIFLARHASSWEDFKKGKDSSGSSSETEYNIMGYYVIKPIGFPPDNARFYLRTSGSPPYCLKDGYLPE